MCQFSWYRSSPIEYEISGTRLNVTVTRNSIMLLDPKRERRYRRRGLGSVKSIIGRSRRVRNVLVAPPRLKCMHVAGKIDVVCASRRIHFSWFFLLLFFLFFYFFLVFRAEKEAAVFVRVTFSPVRAYGRCDIVVVSLCHPATYRVLMFVHLEVYSTARREQSDFTAGFGSVCVKCCARRRLLSVLSRERKRKKQANCTNLFQSSPTERRTGNRSQSETHLPLLNHCIQI
ncbi:hypothetical protein PUN28_005503 [Cardiocondyla obscurior]|uniref:Uncharacterized protein n=1 Tax=Cardiocondyla obscurior TaxID=286306 RepID=A0AAW2GGU5_9HYME